MHPYFKRNKKFELSFTVNKIYSWFWFKNKPVNYNPKVLPRSQGAQPIVQETTDYMVSIRCFKKN